MVLLSVLKIQANILFTSSTHWFIFAEGRKYFINIYPLLSRIEYSAYDSAGENKKKKKEKDKFDHFLLRRSSEHKEIEISVVSYCRERLRRVSLGRDCNYFIRCPQKMLIQASLETGKNHSLSWSSTP